uniref:Iodothyronine deiodinase n=1 Tax=Phallusia mammillata TaxID=59560 RepID=A0A6F9DAE7_9ASCI|nr:type I iodothyronine deiodinase-like [Phallusia mammillata]
MKKIIKFKKLIETYKTVADFVVVYIQEAHPNDDPNLSDIPNLMSAEGRLAAAQLFRENVKIDDVTILVDNVANEANLSYGAMPDRLYGIVDKKIKFVGGTGPFHYKISKVEKWLKRQQNKPKF